MQPQAFPCAEGAHWAKRGGVPEPATYPQNGLNQEGVELRTLKKGAVHGPSSRGSVHA